MKQVNYEELKQRLIKDELSDYSFRERRHNDWKENYQLFRDKVVINRLTQRQSVHLPFIKGLIKTVMANIDEMPSVEFEEQENNKDKEIVFNELWKNFLEADKFEIKDIIDKKQNLLYGKTWLKFNIINGKITTEIKDPYDMLVDKYGDPSDLESYDHISEHGIFRTLDQLLEDDSFDKQAIERLKEKYAGEYGLSRSEETTRIIQDKNERLESLGVTSLIDTDLGGTWVELKIHYKKIWDDEDEKQHIHVIIMCDGEILMAKPLMEIMGIDFYPFVTWSDDPERLDHYPDGLADIARTPNKILNSWISSLVENRTLRNMNMHIFDSSVKGFIPQTFQPAPFGWYGIPVPEGKSLNDIYKTLEIPDLSESIDEINYVKTVVETAVAVNANVQGDVQKQKVTLGEVEIAMGAAKERLTSIAKFYNIAMKEKADKWAKIMNANWDKLESVKLYKKSAKGNYFGKTISYKDWKSDGGYTCRVVSSAEREQQNIEAIQKLQGIKAQFPNNPVVKRVSDKKLLEFADFNPDEIKEVMDYEEQMASQMLPQAQNAPIQGVYPLPEQLTQMPNDPANIGQIQGSI